MPELTDLIWTEKYRPSKFADLILDQKYKDMFMKYKTNPATVPSFIFHSNKPGTGKTSTARVLKQEYECDFLEINSSEERGIDTIRDKLGLFVRALAMSNFKRCVFLDEADGLTPQAQDSLRNLIETYSDNCFFILSCNNLNKIIEPLQSRCTVINFEKPSAIEIYDKLKYICKQEHISIGEDELSDLMDTMYPDIRTMIRHLQQKQYVELCHPQKNFTELYQAILKKDKDTIYNLVYTGVVDVERFNKWVFQKLFDDSGVTFDEAKRKSLLLAENEKAFSLGINKEIVFIANMLQYV